MDLRASTVDIETADGTVDCFLTAPEGLGPHPGVLMYMDIFGPRPRLEEMAERIADEGYVVLMPHTFYRQGRAPLLDTSRLADPDARGELFGQVSGFAQQLTPERLRADAETYVDYLIAHGEVADGPIGTVGYCIGGTWALRTAAHRPEQVAAAAAFHPPGLATDDEDSIHRLADRFRGEVYVAPADQDQGFPPEQQRAFDEALDAAGVTHTVEQYDGAHHGFTMADTAVYDEAATERHWNALFDLFARTLKR